MDITVCIGSSCHLKGSREVVERLQRMIHDHAAEEQINLRGSFCMNHCQTGVSVQLDGEYFSLTPETAELFFIQTVVPRMPSKRNQTETK
jgi:NADH:ubiquinone oxidoreductase subunit E